MAHTLRILWGVAFFLCAMPEFALAMMEEGGEAPHSRNIQQHRAEVEAQIAQEDVQNHAHPANALTHYADGTDLPPDLWRAVFSFLGTDDLALRCVC